MDLNQESRSMHRHVVLFAMVWWSYSVPAQSSVAHQEVRFVAGHDTLAGTLSLPATAGRVPAVLLLSGAGADDRDATNGRFRPFRILADTLAANGFAVLRYDDRGTAASGGRHAWQYTIDEHQQEVAGGIALLRSRSEVDPTRIVLLGHSYGTVMALLAASANAEIQALVLLAPNRGLLASQMDFQEASALVRGRTVSQARDAAVFESTTVAPAVLSGKGWSDVRAAMVRRAREEYEQMPDSSRVRFASFERFFATTVDSFTLSWAAYDHPFFRSFWMHDVLGTARRVRTPVLMLWGDRDRQTPPQPNRAALEAAFAAAGNRDVSSVVIPGANHYLRQATPPDVFAPHVLDTVVTWLSRRVRR